MAGVGAGTGAMGSLLGKLGALLGGEYKLLKSVRKEIEFLKLELGKMHAVLVTLADMEKLDPLHKKWRNNVRELSYLIEDCIDRFMLRLGNGDAKRGFMKKTARRLKTIRARHDIATQIQELKALVVQESERRDRYKVENIVPAKTVEIDSRLNALYKEVKGLVAMAGPMEQVISWLKDDKVVELKVVAIVGPGGLGKTTLAMEVYRNIGGDFQCRASVSVSRTLDLVKLLKDVVSQIDNNEYEKCQRDRWEKEQLKRKISQILTGKRYLIVIDDVWREQDFRNLVETVFPENNNGSRIIATTRSNIVANSCCSNSSDQLYHMAPLNDVESRRLFFKRTFRSDNSCPAELEEVCTRILKKCGGLPLAIITIASLLANKSHHRDEWERLQHSIGVGSSHQSDSNIKGIEDILLLSYWDLPHYLKTCLLYLCIYPEDYNIPCDELKWKWIAEGFIDAQWGRLDQLADNYFNELVNRNMIQQPIEVDSCSSVKYCRVHDMVLDLLVSLSDEEKFATVLNGRVCNSSPSNRRISIQSGDKEHKGAVRRITEAKLHVRSLTVFGAIEQIALVDFHVLRVLDLEGCPLLEDKHVKNIGSLCQLRYLRLGTLNITELPREIGKLQYLETLDLRYCDKIRRLPSTIVQLSKLVCLFLSFCTELPAEKFGSMQALEELCVRKTDNAMRFAEELGHLTKLRKLEMFWSTSDDNAGELLASSLNELGKCNLRYLSIDGIIHLDLFRDSDCTYPHLRDLEMNYMLRIPKGMASMKNVVKLDIQVDTFDEEDLHLLMGMPSLEHLHLELFLFASDVREKVVIGSNGFKRLKVFHLYGELGALAFAPGAMPALRQLRLRLAAENMAAGYCEGIEHLSALEHLHVEIDCDDATRGEVEAMEALVEKAIGGHPISRTPNAHVHLSESMSEDEEEEEFMSEDEEEEEFMSEDDEAEEGLRRGGVDPAGWPPDELMGSQLKRPNLARSDPHMSPPPPPPPAAPPGQKLTHNDAVFYFKAVKDNFQDNRAK